MKSQLIILSIFILFTSCSKQSCPIKGGFINDRKVNSHDISDSFNNLYIKSTKSSMVYSFSSGQVEKIANSDNNGYMIFISSEKNALKLIYVYSNLKEVSVDVGDNVRKQTILGKLNHNEEKTEYTLIFSMLEGTKKVDPQLYINCKKLK